MADSPSADSSMTSTEDGSVRTNTTKLFAMRMLQGYEPAPQSKCSDCRVPMMSYKGSLQCVVCLEEASDTAAAADAGIDFDDDDDEQREEPLPAFVAGNQVVHAPASASLAAAAVAALVEDARSTISAASSSQYKKKSNAKKRRKQKRGRNRGRRDSRNDDDDDDDDEEEISSHERRMTRSVVTDEGVELLPPLLSPLSPVESAGESFNEDTDQEDEEEQQETDEEQHEEDQIEFDEVKQQVEELEEEMEMKEVNEAAIDVDGDIDEDIDEDIDVDIIAASAASRGSSSSSKDSNLFLNDDAPSKSNEDEPITYAPAHVSANRSYPKVVSPRVAAADEEHENIRSLEINPIASGSNNNRLKNAIFMEAINEIARREQEARMLAAAEEPQERLRSSEQTEETHESELMSQLHLDVEPQQQSHQQQRQSQTMQQQPQQQPLEPAEPPSPAQLKPEPKPEPQQHDQDQHQHQEEVLQMPVPGSSDDIAITTGAEEKNNTHASSPGVSVAEESTSTEVTKMQSNKRDMNNAASLNTDGERASHELEVKRNVPIDPDCIDGPMDEAECSSSKGKLAEDGPNVNVTQHAPLNANSDNTSGVINEDDNELACYSKGKAFATQIIQETNSILDDLHSVERSEVVKSYSGGRLSPSRQSLAIDAPIESKKALLRNSRGRSSNSFAAPDDHEADNRDDVLSPSKKNIVQPAINRKDKIDSGMRHQTQKTRPPPSPVNIRRIKGIVLHETAPHRSVEPPADRVPAPPPPVEEDQPANRVPEPAAPTPTRYTFTPPAKARKRITMNTLVSDKELSRDHTQSTGVNGGGSGGWLGGGTPILSPANRKSYNNPNPVSTKSEDCSTKRPFVNAGAIVRGITAHHVSSSVPPEEREGRVDPRDFFNELKHKRLMAKVSEHQAKIGALGAREADRGVDEHDERSAYTRKPMDAPGAKRSQQVNETTMMMHIDTYTHDDVSALESPLPYYSTHDTYTQKSAQASSAANGYAYAYDNVQTSNNSEDPPPHDDHDMAMPSPSIITTEEYQQRWRAANNRQLKQKQLQEEMIAKKKMHLSNTRLARPRRVACTVPDDEKIDSALKCIKEEKVVLPFDENVPKGMPSLSVQLPVSVRQQSDEAATSPISFSLNGISRASVRQQPEARATSPTSFSPSRISRHGGSQAASQAASIAASQHTRSEDMPLSPGGVSNGLRSSHNVDEMSSSSSTVSRQHNDNFSQISQLSEQNEDPPSVSSKSSSALPMDDDSCYSSSASLAPSAYSAKSQGSKEPTSIGDVVTVKEYGQYDAEKEDTASANHDDQPEVEEARDNISTVSSMDHQEEEDVHGNDGGTHALLTVDPSFPSSVGPSPSLASLSSSVHQQTRRIAQLEADALRKHHEAELAATSARQALEKMVAARNHKREKKINKKIYDINVSSHRSMKEVDSVRSSSSNQSEAGSQRSKQSEAGISQRSKQSEVASLGSKQSKALSVPDHVDLSMCSTLGSEKKEIIKEKNKKEQTNAVDTATSPMAVDIATSPMAAESITSIKETKSNDEEESITSSDHVQITYSMASSSQYSRRSQASRARGASCSDKYRFSTTDSFVSKSGTHISYIEDGEEDEDSLPSKKSSLPSRGSRSRNSSHSEGGEDDSVLSGNNRSCRSSRVEEEENGKDNFTNTGTIYQEEKEEYDNDDSTCSSYISNSTTSTFLSRERKRAALKRDEERCARSRSRTRRGARTIYEEENEEDDDEFTNASNSTTSSYYLDMQRHRAALKKDDKRQGCSRNRTRGGVSSTYEEEEGGYDEDSTSASRSTNSTFLNRQRRRKELEEEERQSRSRTREGGRRDVSYNPMTPGVRSTPQSRSRTRNIAPPPMTPETRVTPRSQMHNRNYRVPPAMQQRDDDTHASSVSSRSRSIVDSDSMSISTYSTLVDKRLLDNQRLPSRITTTARRNTFNSNVDGDYQSSRPESNLRSLPSSNSPTRMNHNLYLPSLSSSKLPSLSSPRLSSPLPDPVGTRLSSPLVSSSSRSERAQPENPPSSFHRTQSSPRHNIHKKISEPVAIGNASKPNHLLPYSPRRGYMKVATASSYNETSSSDMRSSNRVGSTGSRPSLLSRRTESEPMKIAVPPSPSSTGREIQTLLSRRTVPEPRSHQHQGHSQHNHQSREPPSHRDAFNPPAEAGLPPFSPRQFSTSLSARMARLGLENGKSSIPNRHSSHARPSLTPKSLHEQERFGFKSYEEQQQRSVTTNYESLSLSHHQTIQERIEQERLAVLNNKQDQALEQAIGQQQQAMAHPQQLPARPHLSRVNVNTNETDSLVLPTTTSSYPSSGHAQYHTASTFGNLNNDSRGAASGETVMYNAGNYGRAATNNYQPTTMLQQQQQEQQQQQQQEELAMQQQQQQQEQLQMEQQEQLQQQQQLQQQAQQQAQQQQQVQQQAQQLQQQQQHQHQHHHHQHQLQRQQELQLQQYHNTSSSKVRFSNASDNGLSESSNQMVGSNQQQKVGGIQQQQPVMVQQPSNNMIYSQQEQQEPDLELGQQHYDASPAYESSVVETRNDLSSMRHVGFS